MLPAYNFFNRLLGGAIHEPLSRSGRGIGRQVADGELGSGQYVFEEERVPVGLDGVAEGGVEHSALAVLSHPGDGVVLVRPLARVRHLVQIKAEQTGEGTNPWGVDVAGFEGETKINRKDFGLGWNATLEKGGVLVGEEIKITLELEVAKQ